MPPRKSDASKASIVGDESIAGPSASTPQGKTPVGGEKDGALGIEDLGLPKSIVTRLAKGVLPSNTQVQGNAMLALSKSATVFVSYLSTHANEYARAANRKTITPADVFDALSDIEFAGFKPQLEAELAKWNENVSEKRRKSKSKSTGDGTGDADKDVATDGGEMEDVELMDNGQPVTKKLRRSGGADGDPAAGTDEETEEESDAADEEEEEEVESGDDREDGDETEPDEQDEQDEQDERDDQDEALDNGEDSS